MDSGPRDAFAAPTSGIAVAAITAAVAGDRLLLRDLLSELESPEAAAEVVWCMATVAAAAVRGLAQSKGIEPDEVLRIVGLVLARAREGGL